MSNENDQTQTPQSDVAPVRVEPVRVHDDSTPGPVVEKPVQVQAAVAPVLTEPAPTPVPASVPAPEPVASGPAREDLYPRADGPVEADRDIPQTSDLQNDDADDEDGDEDEGPEVSVEIPLTGPESVSPQAPAEGGAPSAPAVWMVPLSRVKEAGAVKRLCASTTPLEKSAPGK